MVLSMLILMGVEKADAGREQSYLEGSHSVADVMLIVGRVARSSAVGGRMGR